MSTIWYQYFGFQTIGDDEIRLITSPSSCLQCIFSSRKMVTAVTVEACCHHQELLDTFS